MKTQPCTTPHCRHPARPRAPLCHPCTERHAEAAVLAELRATTSAHAYRHAFAAPGRHQPPPVFDLQRLRPAAINAAGIVTVSALFAVAVVVALSRLTALLGG